ncbi:M48 family metallopeptidase [Weeksellaceae bacterium KMM 9713]|uniref:M48 family metallopeptidase n=1 Tax=Profundicola chukchiensis TaxID=2961959 RepID=A0A9X4N0C1_9FLAO|nr:M48 family metallopeptidase [Profundicola chukchiensis]MDG4946292.1 M48 family metallopeptidase [Profundicola chukchiensis]
MRRSNGFKLRLIIGLVIAAFALFKYYSSSSVNEITGEKQHINITPEQEIRLGLDGRDYMIQESGGLYQDAEVQQYIDLLGRKIVENSDASKTPYQYEFHVLADPNQVNAFAMPGGQIFITVGLLKRLESEDQVAGVLGHEIGHVVGRHSAEQMAKQDLTQGLAGAAGVVGGDMSSAQYAQMIGNMVNMKYGREDELESDELGVRFMVQSGYDPHALIRVMEILDEASGGQAPPEFQSTHPSPENRVQRIKEAIEKYGGSATPNTNSNKLPSKVPSNTSGDY